jgi:hypothetical protein
MSPDEKSLDDILVDSAYDGYFMGKSARIINAPEEIALPALKRIIQPHGIALAWHKYGEAYRFMLVSNDKTVDAGVIARTVGGGDGNREVSTFTAGKLLLKG